MENMCLNNTRTIICFFSDYVWFLSFFSYFCITHFNSHSHSHCSQQFSFYSSKCLKRRISNVNVVWQTFVEKRFRWTVYFKSFRLCMCVILYLVCCCCSRDMFNWIELPFELYIFLLCDEKSSSIYRYWISC